MVYVFVTLADCFRVNGFAANLHLVNAGSTIFFYGETGRSDRCITLAFKIKGCRTERQCVVDIIAGIIISEFNISGSRIRKRTHCHDALKVEYAVGAAHRNLTDSDVVAYDIAVGVDRSI